MAQLNEKIKLASVMLLTPLRIDVCVWYTEAWVLCVTQLQKHPQRPVCVSFPSSPPSLCTADQIKWTVHQSVSVLIIPSVFSHLSLPAQVWSWFCVSYLDLLSQLLF